MDDDTIAEMVRRKIYYVPTIDHNQYYIENGEMYHFPGDYRDRLSQFMARNTETARRAFKAGAMLVMGSDAGIPGGIEHARARTLRVTSRAPGSQVQSEADGEDRAECSGRVSSGSSATTSAVAPGYYADLVAVEGDPLANIVAVTKNVRWVMKGGRVVVNRTEIATR
jgi:imidazolonepropionase-like amidohydrolase